MLRRPNPVASRNLIAALAGLALALPVSVAFSQAAATQGSQDQASAGDHTASKKSVRQLTDEVKKQDEQIRQSNAELKKSNERLTRAQHDLDKTQAQERHLASSERHTANAERKAGHKVDTAHEQSNPGENPPDNGQTGTPR